MNPMKKMALAAAALATLGGPNPAAKTKAKAKAKAKAKPTGAEIAARDLAAKRKANKAIPTFNVMTRQRDRAAARQDAKGHGVTDKKTGVFSYVK